MQRSTVALSRAATKSQQYVCWKCQQRRNISTTFLKKKADAKAQWDQWAKEIRLDRRPSLLKFLEDRGFIHAIAGEREALEKLITEKRPGVYCGVDPTAPSLHVGHMLPLMAVFWMYVKGAHAATLVGTNTAKIGDPTGRNAERREMSSIERKSNMTSIHYQMKKLWMNVERVAAKQGYKWEPYWHRELLNNGVWWGKTTFVEVLQRLGKGLRIGAMLSRETVKTRMESGDGMSFAEFCYPIMQAWDWWHIYQTKDIQLQVGGSDQYGNIVAGIEAIKYVAKTHSDPDVRQEGGVHEHRTPYGFTVPLLTSASGEKFGKSAGNAVWLDENMTSLFDLYGFFIRTADTDVERYLKLFTFLSLEEIQSLMKQHQEDPSKRVAQHALAFQFLDLVHGEAAAKRAEYQHRSLFSKTAVPPPEDPPLVHDNPLQTGKMPHTRARGNSWSSSLNPFASQTSPSQTPSLHRDIHAVLPKSLVFEQPISRVLHAAGLVSSRSEGHRLASNGGAYIGRRASDKEQMRDDLSFVPAKVRDPAQTWRYVIQPEGVDEATAPGDEGLLILRVGKWKVRICRVVSDAAFEALEDGAVAQRTPGWRERKAQMISEAAKDDFEQWSEEFEPPDGRRRKGKNPGGVPVIMAKRFEAEQRQDAKKYFVDRAAEQGKA